jgi:asperthecin polyketide synthase
MNVTNVEVLHAQVAQKHTSSAQLLQLEAKINLFEQAMTIHWYNVSADGIRSEDSFASATVRFEDSAAWQTEWDRVSHLVNGRIEGLSRMAADAPRTSFQRI